MKSFILSATLLMFPITLILLVSGQLTLYVCFCMCVSVLYVHTSWMNVNVCLILTYSSFFHSAYHSCDNYFFSWAVQNHSVNPKHYFTERPHEHNSSWTTGKKQRDKITSSSVYNQNASCNKYFSPTRAILRGIRQERNKVASDTKGNASWTTMPQRNKRYFL